MGFDVKSRRGLVRAYREKWEKKNRLVLALLSKKEKQLVEEMLTGRGGRTSAGNSTGKYGRKESVRIDK